MTQEIKTWHSADCLKSQAEHDSHNNVYKVRYPNYCQTCGGWGGVWDEYDPSPAGVSLASGSIADFEPCEKCAGAIPPKCPRCGYYYLRWVLQAEEDGDFTSCPECGFSFEGAEDGLLEPPQCFCPDTCHQCEQINMFMTEGDTCNECVDKQ